MKVLFLGAYDKAEIVLAPIKVGRELFKHISAKGVNSVYLCYFDDGSKYTRIQKLFGFEKISDRVYRCGIFPFLFFTVKYKPNIIQIVTPDAYYLPIYLLKSFLNFKVAYLSHSIISYYLKNFLTINCYQKLRLYFIEKIALKFSDLLQMLSKTEARFTAKYLRVKSSKIRIVDNGINLYGLKKAYTDNSDSIKIICIGSLSRKEKSFDILFNAISKIDEQLLVTVYGYEEQGYDRVNLPANVRLFMKKPVNEVELRQEMCRDDLFILPSRYESFSLSLLEAMETGILFISSDRVGLTSRFPESLKRFIVTYGNAGELKNKILELHSLKVKDKNKLSQEIREFASAFKWNAISNNYLEHYNALLQK